MEEHKDSREDLLNSFIIHFTLPQQFSNNGQLLDQPKADGEGVAGGVPEEWHIDIDIRGREEKVDDYKCVRPAISKSHSCERQLSSLCPGRYLEA